ncbi:YHYH domain-containing protein [Pseudidiomarina halophila]|uniref:YHYH domain-containing protein n=1 Tax=Pseudidiomarina halophila TaxID=1449799 RepID=A0A432XRM6_9GAMM|nr:hypothetical protein CWI69_12040 [Pseudidiomarina halophila]
MKSLALAIITILIVFINVNAEAHSGRTNAAGCHTNNKTGNYHCHNAKTPTTTTYCHVFNGTSRCGYAYSSCQALVRKHGGYCTES